MNTTFDPATLLAFILAAGVVAQWVAERFRFPSILPLLLIGFVVGPVTGFLNPDAVFGDLLLPGVQLGVAVILFEGALTLRFADIKGAGNIVLRLITVGVVVTIAVIALATRFALGFDWQLALLFGAIVSVTGPTVIIPLLRAVRPSERLSRVLRWEGILIDPVGAVLAVIMFEVIMAGTASNSEPLIDFAKLFILGSLVGAAGGFLMGTLLKKHLLPDYLINVTALSSVLLTFVLANLIAHEGGLVAVTVMGLVMGNSQGIPKDSILDFKESLSLLLISALFIILAARLDLDALLALGPALGIVLVIILFVARPLTAFASTVGTDMPWRERILLGWMAPRGIVAAAVSALFALQLDAAGIVDGHLLVPLTFSVIVATVVIHSLTSRPFAKLLNVAEPEARGVLIVGGNPVAIKIAQILQENNIKVLMADASWAQVRQARMLGIPVFFGHAVSDIADRKLDLLGLGTLLALSRDPALNALSCLRYRTEFGRANVYTVRRDQKFMERERETVTFNFRGRLLFKESMTLDRLESELEQGRKIHLTPISSDYSFDDLLEKAGDTSPMLFAISPRGKLYPFSDDPTFRIGTKWRVAWLSMNGNPIQNNKKKEKDDKTSNLPKPGTPQPNLP